VEAQCGHKCPYDAHAPESAEGYTAWNAATACIQADMNGISMDMPAALSLMREGDVSGWAAAQLLVAIRAGMMMASNAKEVTNG
jgi:hypothetical protein